MLEITLVICLYLLAVGNLTSLNYPRAVNPERSWGRASRGKVALLLLLTYPLLGIPVLLAYAARFAFESQAAFYGVLAFSAACGAARIRKAGGDGVTAAGETDPRRIKRHCTGPGTRNVALTELIVSVASAGVPAGRPAGYSKFSCSMI